MVVGACGFSSNLGPDAMDTPDAAVDAQLGSAHDCIQRWFVGPAFTPPVMLALANTAGNESDPWVSPDGLTLYFSLSSDVWVSRRSSVYEPFPVAMRDAGLSSTELDTKLSF